MGFLSSHYLAECKFRKIGSVLKQWDYVLAISFKYIILQTITSRIKYEKLNTFLRRKIANAQKRVTGKSSEVHHGSLWGLNCLKDDGLEPITAQIHDSTVKILWIKLYHVI